MAKHLAKKAACLIGSAAVALSMTLGAFPVYADSAASAPELGPVTSKDVVYQIITDRSMMETHPTTFPQDLMQRSMMEPGRI